MASRPKLKVRTGCLTCKARKVKCDESRPLCRRCAASGRKCDGYADSTDSWRARPHIPAKAFCTLDADRSVSHVLNSSERHWLDHFSTRAGPALSGSPGYRYFWSVELPQISLSVPAIRHALLAVSSCHARLEFQLGSGKQVDDVAAQDLTIKQYSLAIASLRQSLDLPCTELEVPLICCLLFICLECLYGNTILTLTHLENGLKILKSLRSRKSRNPALKSIAEKLEHIFSNFEAQSTVFGVSTSFSPKAPKSMDFADAFGARTSLDALITDCMNFVKQMGNLSGEGQVYADDTKVALQRTLLDQLLAWETQMQSLEQNDSPRVDRDDTAVIMLHIREEATFVYVAVCLDRVQTLCDTFLPRFETIVGLIESFKMHSYNTTSPAMLACRSTVFSLESSVIPALYLTAIRCRDPALRRRAVDLLETHPNREGLWDARLFVKAARRVIEIEEASLKSDQQLAAQWPAEHSRVYHIDVLRISEEPAREARLVFYTAPYGHLNDKVIWSEDVTF